MYLLLTTKLLSSYFQETLYRKASKISFEKHEKFSLNDCTVIIHGYQNNIRMQIQLEQEIDALTSRLENILMFIFTK